MIAQTVKKLQKKWDKFLPELAFAYNTAHSESIGYTPAYLDYGREPLGSVLQKAAQSSQKSTKDRISQLHAAIE